MATDYIFKNEPIDMWYVDDINKMLLWAVDIKASDVNLEPNKPIWIKVDGKWHQATSRKLNSQEIFMLMDRMTRDDGCSARVQSGEPEPFGYDIKIDQYKKQSFRGEATACKEGWEIGGIITLRVGQALPPTHETLGLEPELLEAATPENGLVLVTGVMGSGKTTLIAAILRHIIETKHKSVATFEDPIEFDYSAIKNPTGPVSQAEVPLHLKTFEACIKNATRRALDVILMGELRDLPTMSGTFEAAEIGVAAYGTLHTKSVPETPSRIINKFPDSVQNQIATTMMSAARLFIQQRLVPKIGGGRIAIKEWLEFDEADRTELIKLPTAQLTPAINELLQAKGHPLLMDVEEKLNAGLIPEKEYLKVKKEKQVA